MTEKIGIICGGRSGEHRVSLMSALVVSQALDPQLYEPLLLAINQQGQWQLGNSLALLSEVQETKTIHISPRAKPCIPVNQTNCIRWVDPQSLAPLADITTFFPLIHGTDGEDGTLQGWLNMANVPFVGTEVASSAICIDKDLTKKLLTQANLPCAPWMVFEHPQPPPSWDVVSRQLGADVFIKPARLGSSVAVQRTQNNQDYQQALQDALKYDHKILIEKTIPARELECSVLGSPGSSIQKPMASVLGEIKPQQDFYSYHAKYINPKAAILEIPVQLPATLQKQAQELALQVCQTLDIRAMARVDFFLTPSNQWLINEVNTIPGFTPISMYPKLLQAGGISYSKILHILIQLAKEHHQQKQVLQRSYS